MFIGFIEEELRLHGAPNEDGRSHRTVSRSSSQETLESNTRTRHPGRIDTSSHGRRKGRHHSNSTVISSSEMIPATLPTINPSIRSSPLLTPLIPLYALHAGMREGNPNFSVLPPIPQSPPATGSLDAATPTPGGFQRRTRSGTAEGSSHSTTTAGGQTITTSPPLPGSALGKEEYFSSRARQQGGVPGSPLDDFSGWAGPTTPTVPKTEPPPPATPITPGGGGGGGLMGRLRNFGKIGKRPVSDAPNVANVVTPTSEAPDQAEVRIFSFFSYLYLFFLVFSFSFCLIVLIFFSLLLGFRSSQRKRPFTCSCPDP